MIALRRVQQSSRCSGFVARARQTFGTRSIFLVARMSSKTARTRGSGVFSSTSFTVPMRFPSGDLIHIPPQLAVQLLGQFVVAVADVIDLPDVPRLGLRLGHPRWRLRRVTN